MCTVLALTKFSEGFNFVYSNLISGYCKAAIKLFDTTKQRTIILPFKISLQDLFSDDEELSDVASDMSDDISETEYMTVNVLNIDPEIYYFFKFYTNKISTFEQMIASCKIDYKERYVMDLVDSENQLELIFDEDNNRIYVEYVAKHLSQK